MEKTTIAVILGPTACGKTGASIQVAKLLQAEIVSADSIQIYHECNIGSAKPTQEEMQGVPHHMMGIIPAATPSYSVSEFKEQATDCIADIHARGKLPLIVGGTGLYVNSLTYPLEFTEVPRDQDVRTKLMEAEDLEPGSNYAQLLQVDPLTAKRLHPNDKKRVIRALEVYMVSGKPFSSFGQDFQNEAAKELPYRPIIVGLTMDREMLYERINKRVDLMMQSGMVEEVEALYRTGLDITLPAMQGIGYKQLIQHFKGEYTLEEAVELIKRETRRFAKRQWTWFKRDARIHWIDVLQYPSVQELAQEITDYIQSKL